MMYSNLNSVIRPKGWTPVFQSSSAGFIQGHGELAFHMAILNRKQENLLILLVLL